ncbi:MAG: hypothetical protein AB1768_20565 [Pseudomonadota bacterium]
MNLTKDELRFLSALRETPRDNRWVQEHFGMGRAWRLMNAGLVDNPLGVAGNAHTNLWQLTAQGRRALEANCE